MMKNSFKLVFVVACIMVITACTKVVEVKVPNGSTFMVVDAFLDNDADTQKVRLTTTADYFSNKPTPPIIGATVLLQDITANISYNLIDDGKGNYFHSSSPFYSDTIIKRDHEYKLNISYNGNTYYATSTAHRTIPVDYIFFLNSKNPAAITNPGDTTNPRIFYPWVVAIDSIGPDYYWQKAYKNGIFYNEPRQLNVYQDAGGKSLDGDTLYISAAFLGITSDKNPIYRNDLFTVKIYSINADTYSYLSQLQSQLTNAQNGLFALTPQNVKTNIKQTNGSLTAIGWFNVGLVKSKSAIAH